MTWRAWALLALVGCVGACSDDEGGGSTFCEPGSTRSCGCIAGGTSVRTCLDDGSDYGDCECDGVTPTGGNGGSGGTPPATGGGPSPSPDAGPVSTGPSCGDGQCMRDEGETCARCATDCGECVSVECACGDGVCDQARCGEACGACVDDCGTCAACDDDAGSCDRCGDGVCGNSESPADCEQDCGSDPGEAAYNCGNGACEAGEDSDCADCADVEQTCDSACTDHSDCAQPWTGCIGGGGKCIPLECQGCFNSMQFCCWCDNNLCSGVSCAASLAECPACP